MTSNSYYYNVTVVKETLVTYGIYAESIDKAMDLVMNDDSPADHIHTTFGDERVISIQEVMHYE